MSCTNKYRDSSVAENAVVTCNHHPSYHRVQGVPVASDTNNFRYYDIQNYSSHVPTSIPMNIGVGKEHLRVHQGKAETMSSMCRSQRTLPYYTKYLEEKISEIQEQNINLNNQLSQISIRNQKLEKKLTKLDEPLKKQNIKNKSLPVQTQCNTSQCEVNTVISGVLMLLEASTSTELPKMCERAVQIVEQEHLPIEDTDKRSQLDTITRTEFDDIISNMKILRNTIKTKEDIWNQAFEREQNYREHLARLSVELITARQVSDSRYNELQTVSQKLMEAKENLRETSKDLLQAKRHIQKLLKYQRNSECHNNDESTTTIATDNIESREKQLRRPDSQEQSSVTKQKVK